MYPWNACLQLPLMHTSSASKTPCVFFSSAPDGGYDTRGLSFFHAIHTGLDRVKKKGTSTLDRPAKRALKTAHPASANCTNIVLQHEPLQLSVFFQSVFVLQLTCLYMLTVCYRYLSASTGKTKKRERKKKKKKRSWLQARGMFLKSTLLFVTWFCIERETRRERVDWQRILCFKYCERISYENVLYFSDISPRAIKSYFIVLEIIDKHWCTVCHKNRSKEGITHYAFRNMTFMSCL